MSDQMAGRRRRQDDKPVRVVSPMIQECGQCHHLIPDGEWFYAVGRDLDHCCGQCVQEALASGVIEGSEATP